MSILEGLIEGVGGGGGGGGGGDRDDGCKLGLPLVPARRSHHDLLTGLPVEVGALESEGVVVGLGVGCKTSPSLCGARAVEVNLPPSYRRDNL